MHLRAQKRVRASARTHEIGTLDAPKRRTVAFDRAKFESVKVLLQRTPRCDVSRRARVARACCFSRDRKRIS